MEFEYGELLTRWTVRLAVACYLLRLSFDATGSRTPVARRVALWAWTTGCVLMVIHVMCAFAYYHAWSHLEAYEHTARVTASSVGVDWGGGIFFNYLFLGIWIGDVVAWWWMGGLHAQRWVYWAVQTIFAFMMINATVVFGPPAWRWVAGAVATSLILIRMESRRRPERH